ncbi:MAG: hypothetical protein J6X59_01260 [Bacteroidales bacterium]|nr:hypothetical protein [Bacteroidales bacterium]
MKKLKTIALLLVCAFSVFAVSFTTIPPKTNEQVALSSISLEGKTCWIRTNDYYFTLVFTSNNDVFQEGYYIENGEGYGAWSGDYHYSYDGNKGIIWKDWGGGGTVGEFYVSTDENGKPMSLILKLYDMEPGGVRQCSMMFKR